MKLIDNCFFDFYQNKNYSLNTWVKIAKDKKT